MWSSRSAWRNCWRACAWRCGGKCAPFRGEPTVKVGPLTIDLAARAVMLNDKRLTLTPKEYRLLQVLAQHAGNVVTHQHLLKEVWGSIHVHDTHYLRIFVRKLRQKIEPHPDSPKILVTELGVGYRLVQSGGDGEAGTWSDSARRQERNVTAAALTLFRASCADRPRGLPGFLDRPHYSPP